MKKLILVLAIFLLLTEHFSCSDSDVPVATSWVGLKTKKEETVEKLFRTAGKGVDEVKWWAGGYLWQNGYFLIELVDVKKNKTVFRKEFLYGDEKTGSSEEPRFHWWHSEAQGKIILSANRIYKMKLTVRRPAQPGAGWGLWLYRLGED